MQATKLITEIVRIKYAESGSNKKLYLIMGEKEVKINMDGRTTGKHNYCCCNTKT